MIKLQKQNDKNPKYRQNFKIRLLIGSRLLKINEIQDDSSKPRESLGPHLTATPHNQMVIKENLRQKDMAYKQVLGPP